MITLDPLGHGKSDRPVDMWRYMITAYAEEVIALLDHLDVDEAVIGGTSLFGGRGRPRDAVLGALVIVMIPNGIGLKPNLGGYDVPMQFDFRSMYATLINWLGVDPKMVVGNFPLIPFMQ